MKKLIIAGLLCVVMLAGCSSGVSQEEYDRVVAERDELQAQLNAINGAPVQEESAQPASEPTEEATEEDIEVVSDYIYPDGIGWYTYRYLVIKNNSSSTVDVSTSTLAYSSDGSMVAADDSGCEAVGPGCTSIIEEAFETESEIDHYETDFTVRDDGYYESVLQDLSYTQNDVDGGAVFQVTNNGGEPAEFVQGYALFFLGDELVYRDSRYFTDDDSEIKPGETISKQMTSYEDFDRIEFYLTGRRTAW